MISKEKANILIQGLLAIIEESAEKTAARNIAEQTLEEYYKEEI
tara:strand:+ start:2035 stop:2166 length:132 start_codon:yes stop_codon:yes gene_type:complete